jgi:predicted ester cyclase
MKTRMTMATVLALATIGAGACKKKKTEEGAPKTTEPTPKMGSDKMAGSDMTKPSEPVKPVKPVKKEGKDLAQVYLECGKLMSSNKMDDFKKTCMADGFVSHMADMGQMTQDQVMEEFKNMAAMSSDAKFEPQMILINGRNVFAVALSTGTQTGPMKMPGMPEIPATNKKWGSIFLHRLAINDENKATEEWGWMDPSTMMGQLGLLPKTAPPARPVMEKGMDGAPMIIVAADDEKEKKNLAAAQAATKAFESKKIADIMATYTDDAWASDQADSKDLKGKKEIQASTEMFLKAFPDFKVVDPQYFAGGDVVVMFGKFEGTNSGPLGKMKATNKKVSGEFAEVMEFKDGKVAKFWRFRNGMAMAMQMGLIPPMGGDAPKGDAPKGDAPKGDAPKKDDKKAPAKKDDAKKSG